MLVLNTEKPLKKYDNCNFFALLNRLITVIALKERKVIVPSSMKQQRYYMW